MLFFPLNFYLALFSKACGQNSEKEKLLIDTLQWGNWALDEFWAVVPIFS